jgi:hypothetical protein
VALAAGSGDGPGVALLPLAAGEGVSAKEAAGTTVLLRQALLDGGYVHVANERKDDEKVAKKCALIASCLADAAYARGVVLVGAGVVHADPGGTRIELVVIGPRDPDFVRVIDRTIAASDLLAGLDRLAREAFRPSALRGALDVNGRPEGARVLVDGVPKGTLPLAEPIADLEEGERVVEIVLPGYTTVKRPVKIVHRETTSIDVTMSVSEERTRAVSEDDGGSIVWLHSAGPGALFAIGAAALAGGIVCGVLAYIDEVEIEKRAASQQLVLPKDRVLFQRGFAAAVAADVLYVLSASSLVVAATWVGVAFAFGGYGSFGSGADDDGAPAGTAP